MSKITRLSVMMFLQFFIWGAWYVTIGNYMTAMDMADLTHWPYTVNPLAAIISPFFLGMIADRYFATEKVLGVLHILGGVVMFMVPQTSGSPVLFIGMLALYNLCYMPTLGLTNSLAFHHITDQEKQFPMIRVFGTIGWIVAGLFISFVLAGFVSGDRLPDETALPLYTAAVASVLLGVFSFFLPHTPPSNKGAAVSIRSILGVDAFKQLKSKPFLAFLASSFLISIPLAAYYNFAPIFVNAAGLSNPAATLSLGQVSEVVFMLLMPIFFIRLGVKWMLVVGMGAWVLRYLLFALAAPAGIFWMILGGILMHGICYDFFFVTGQIYVDKKSTPEIRGQAQGMLVLVTYGLGMFIGAQIAGNVFNAFLAGEAALSAAQWQDFWYIPAAFAAAIMVFFMFTFNDKVKTEDA
ncbi:MAG: nucleoside transporter [Rhodothermales bacterium]|jgi:nucleoside transporter